MIGIRKGLEVALKLASITNGRVAFADSMHVKA